MNSTLTLSMLTKGFLIRHAEKDTQGSVREDLDMRLSEGGRRGAERLGATMGSQLKTLVSSSVPRCLETAEAIRTGAGRPIPLLSDWRLGNPGVWVIDTEAAGEAFRTLGPREVVRRQLAGETVPGLRDMKGGARLLLECILSHLPEGGGYVVFVSHDAVIAPLIGHLINCVDIEAIWPDFLEQVVFTRGDDELTMEWRIRIRTFSHEEPWLEK